MSGAGRLLTIRSCTEFLRFPARLGQLAVRFLCEAEIVGALDGHFLADVQDLAHDFEVVFLGLFVDHAIGRKSSDHAVVSTRGQLPVQLGKLRRHIRPRGSA